MEAHSKPLLLLPSARRVISWSQQVGITALSCLAHETGERIRGWPGLFPTQLSGTLPQVSQLALPSSDVFNYNCGKGKGFDSLKVSGGWGFCKGILENQGRRHKLNSYSVFPWPPAKLFFVLEGPIVDKYGLPTARHGLGKLPSRWFNSVCASQGPMWQTIASIGVSGQSHRYKIIVGW